MKSTVRVAPAAAALFAASFLTRSCATAAAPAAAAAAGAPQTGTDVHRALGDDDDPYVDYSCTVDLFDARRPMFTEKEMKRFDNSFVKCAEQIATNGDSGEPKFDFVEVLGQVLVDSRRRLLGGGREERRLRRKTNRVETSARCRCCPDMPLPTDRRLGGEEAEAGHPYVDRVLAAFDDCMQYELTRDVEGDDYDLAAFHGLDEVSTSCSITVLGNQTFDVLSDGANNTAVDETCICDTTIHGATAPMLSEREMLHFDRCWIKEYNEFHSIDPTKALMMSSEIMKQDPPTGTNRLARRLMGKKNKVVSRKSTCRSCKDEVLGGDRKLTVDHHGRELEIDIVTFDERLRDCLVSGVDDATNATYDAFAGQLAVETSCDEPVPTVQEFEEQQALARTAFDEAQDSAKEVFVAEWKEEKKQLEQAEVEHKLKMQRFEYEQKAEELEFQQYQAYMTQVAAEQMKSSCIRPMERSGCNDVMDAMPPTLLWVKEAKVLKVKFEFQQGFGLDTITGQCADEDSEVQYYIRYAKEKKEDEPDPEYECKYESKKCGATKGYESKYCYWDESLSIMAADVELVFPIADLLPGDSETNRMRRLEDEQVFLDTRARARQRRDYCYLHYKLDCNCQAIPD